MKVKSESEVAQSCPTLSDARDCIPLGSSVHGILQARVLEWGAIAFSSYLYNSLNLCLLYVTSWFDSGDKFWAEISQKCCCVLPRACNQEARAGGLYHSWDVSIPYCLIKLMSVRFLCWIVKKLLLSCPSLFLTPWTVACHVPLSMDFPGKNTRVAHRFLRPGIFLTQGANQHLLHWQADSLPLSHWGSPQLINMYDECVD